MPGGRPDAEPRWTVLGVPIDSVAAPVGGAVFGTEAAPAALRALDLVHRLGGVDAGDLDVRVVGPDRDPVSGIVGWPSLRPVTVALRRAVADLVGAGARPLLLGGCCALLPGAVAGARDAAGRIGLAYVDGHVDLYDNRTSPTGEAADMPVAALLGRGWPEWLDALGQLPVVTGPDVVVLGARDEQEAADLGALPQQLGVTVLDPDQVRAGPTTLDLLAAQQFWLHLDLDVLDEVAFPATDSLMPGGLELAELADLLRPFGRSDRIIGASIGCYNPSKDDDAVTYGRALADLLVDVLLP